MRKNKYFVFITYLVRNILAVKEEDKYRVENTIVYVELTVKNEFNGADFFSGIVEAAKNIVHVQTNTKAMPENMTVTNIVKIDEAPLEVAPILEP